MPTEDWCEVTGQMAGGSRSNVEINTSAFENLLHTEKYQQSSVKLLHD